jgi:hypothetical protein
MSDPESITCPDCGLTSWHPEDVRYGWCANCEDYTSERMPLNELAERASLSAFGYGEREVTPEDRRRAVLHELVNSRSNVRITEGMRRGLRRGKRRSWWRRAIQRVRP